MLHDVESVNRGLLDLLLDPDVVTVEERRITMPHSGEVTLAIIRSGPVTTHTMDIWERETRLIEEFTRNQLLETRQSVVQ